MADEWGPWIGWNGGECPVDPDAITQPCLRGYGIGESGRAHGWRWDHRGGCLDIIAYRVKREPVVETVDCRLYIDCSEGGTRIRQKVRHGTVQTRDGIPDMTTLRWEDAE